MEQAWYFMRDGQTAGPFQWLELQTLAAGGKVQPTDRVWSEGMAEWTEAAGVAELFASSPPRTESPATQSYVAPQPVMATSLPLGAAAVGGGQFPGVPFIDYSSIARPQVRFAGFFARFLASMIDGIIIVVLGVFLAMIFTWWVGEETVRANAPMCDLFLRLMFVILSWIYCATLESGSWQATFGKLALGIKVTDLAGNPISFGRASGRHFGKVISQLIFMLGYLMMKFNASSQCLHDMMAGCLVMKKEWE